jgi:hypothetical protein
LHDIALGKATTLVERLKDQGFEVLDLTDFSQHPP